LNNHNCNLSPGNVLLFHIRLNRYNYNFPYTGIHIYIFTTLQFPSICLIVYLFFLFTIFINVYTSLLLQISVVSNAGKL
jgi:hypothetical protein